MYADGGVLSGWGCETADRAYGLNDPSLAGFNPFKILAAPFKIAAKGVKVAVTTAVKYGVPMVAGMVGGEGGGFASQYTQTPVQSYGTYPRSNPTYNPYGVAAQPYGAAQYQQPYRPPRRSAGEQVASMFNLLKDELLAAGARRVVATPAGQVAIREKVSGDIGRYLLPISIGFGALMLTLVMVRR